MGGNQTGGEHAGQAGWYLTREGWKPEAEIREGVRLAGGDSGAPIEQVVDAYNRAAPASGQYQGPGAGSGTRGDYGYGGLLTGVGQYNQAYYDLRKRQTDAQITDAQERLKLAQTASDRAQAAQDLQKAQYQAELNERQRQFDLLHLSLQPGQFDIANEIQNRQFHERLTSDFAQNLLNAAANMGGPGDWDKYLTLMNQGSDVLAALTGRQRPGLAEAAQAEGIRPRSVTDILSRLGYGGLGPEQPVPRLSDIAARIPPVPNVPGTGGAPQTTGIGQRLRDLYTAMNAKRGGIGIKEDDPEFIAQASAVSGLSPEATQRLLLQGRAYMNATGQDVSNELIDRWAGQLGGGQEDPRIPPKRDIGQTYQGWNPALPPGPGIPNAEGGSWRQPPPPDNSGDWEYTQFGDASLGHPQPGMMYAQVITPGWHNRRTGETRAITAPPPQPTTQRTYQGPTYQGWDPALGSAGTGVNRLPANPDPAMQYATATGQPNRFASAMMNGGAAAPTDRIPDAPAPTPTPTPAPESGEITGGPHQPTDLRWDPATGRFVGPTAGTTPTAPTTSGNPYLPWLTGEATAIRNPWQVNVADWDRATSNPDARERIYGYLSRMGHSPTTFTWGVNQTRPRGFASPETSYQYQQPQSAFA